MSRSNAIIECLKIAPKIAKDLPYKPAMQKFGIENRMLLQKIHVSAHRYRKGQPPHKQFITVYYLLGDLDRAVKLFVQVNSDTLSTVNFARNNLLWSGLQKITAKKIVAEYKNFKVLQPKTL